MTDVTNFSRHIGMRGTKAQVEAYTGTLEEQALAYATDTTEIGIYTNGAWVWFLSSQPTVIPPPYISAYDDGVFVGSGTNLRFDGNLTVGISGSMIRVVAPVTTYQRFGQPVPLNGVTGTLWQVPDRVYASGSLGVFYNGLMQTVGLNYEELIYVSGTYNLLFIPATGVAHMVSYGVPCTPQTYSTGTGSLFNLLDSDTVLLLDSDGVQLLDSDG